MPKQDLVNAHNFTVVTADNKEDEQANRTDKQLADAQEEAKKTGATLNITRSQSFQVVEAETWAEAAELVQNEEVRLDYFNRGFTLAQYNQKSKLMSDSEWPGYDGAYALINDVQLPKQRRVADPASAARRALKAMWAQTNPGAPEPTDEEISNVLRMFMQTATAPPADDNAVAVTG